MKIETMYIALDGKEFDKENDCKNHELSLFYKWLEFQLDYQHLFVLDSLFENQVVSKGSAGELLRDLFLKTSGDLPIFNGNLVTSK